jgi:hypothetical protein
VDNGGYRTAGWIGASGFQIVGGETVSSTDGAIETTFTKDQGNVSVHFHFRNFRTRSIEFSLVVAANLSLGDGPSPSIEFWKDPGDFKITSADHQIVWDTFGSATSGFIGDPYANMGTVDDPDYRYDSPTSAQTMLRVHAGRLYFSLSVDSLSSRNITIRLSGSVVRQPPFVDLGSYPEAVTTGWVNIAWTYQAIGFPDQSFELTVIGVPIGAPDASNSYFFSSSTGILSSDGRYSGTASSYGNFDYPVGTYALFMQVRDPSGGAVLHDNIGTIEVLGPTTAIGTAAPSRSVIPPKATARATPTAATAAGPRPTASKSPQRHFTASFAVRRSRVRKIFQYSYLIPIILNR